MRSEKHGRANGRMRYQSVPATGSCDTSISWNPEPWKFGPPDAMPSGLGEVPETERRNGEMTPRSDRRAPSGGGLRKSLAAAPSGEWVRKCTDAEMFISCSWQNHVLRK